ncbi:MAG: tRNA (adenine-N1)-methyltransferase [Candidatus Hodarchaeales archaeon]
MSNDSRVLQEGDLVLIETVDRKRWIIKLQPGLKTHTHLGSFNHDSLIGKYKHGSTIKFPRGKLMVLRPVLRDFVEKYVKPTNILYEDDASALVGLAGLKHGDSVLEIGTGSGGLTTYIANAVGPAGRVYTIDINEDHSNAARKNLSTANMIQQVEIITGDIVKNPDILPVSSILTIFIDVPSPWAVFDRIDQILLPGGQVLVFVPNWSQIANVVAKASSMNYYFSDIFEIIRRDYKVDPPKEICRPFNRQVVFTGIIARAVKLGDRIANSNT